MGGAASIPTDPSRNLQVIGAGYSRTGTVSMQMALEILLKGPVAHGGTQILAREDAYCKSWIEAYRAREAGDRMATLKHVRDGTRGFVGTADLPTIDFIPEMLELYPDARVVLVRRDPERWWRSTQALAGNASLWWLPYVMWPIPGWRWFPSFIDAFAKSANRLVGVPPGTRDSSGPSKGIIIQHNEMVRKVVPPEKLLEMELGQGWEPLCEFLGLPVPDQPFPRANDVDSMQQTAKQIMGRIAQVWLGIFSATGVVICSSLWLWNRIKIAI